MEEKTRDCPLLKGTECMKGNCVWFYGADCAVVTIAGALQAQAEK